MALNSVPDPIMKAMAKRLGLDSTDGDQLQTSVSKTKESRQKESKGNKRGS